MKILKFRKCGALFVCLTTGIFIFLTANLSGAAEYCVGTEAELDFALFDAQGNGEDDIIRILQGTYIGTFEYDATIEDEAHSLTILGGYKPKPPRCKKRVVDPANTVLDGDEDGAVLVLSAPDVAADFVVSGLTLQNGNKPQEGGLYVNSNNSGLSVMNCAILNNFGSSSGGMNLIANTVEITDSIISKNTRKGGFIQAGIVIVSNSIISENLNDDSYLPAGGLQIIGGNIKLTDNTFLNNTGWTGAAYIENDTGIFNGNTIILENNTIRHNTGRYRSAGVRVIAGTLTMNNNTFEYNKGTSPDPRHDTLAGAINGRCDILSLQGNIISFNDGGEYGAVVLTVRESAIIINNVVNGNTSLRNGGNLTIASPYDLVLINNTIISNSAPEGCGGVSLQFQDYAEIHNNIIMGNSSAVVKDSYINNDHNGDSDPSPVYLYNNDFDQSADGIYFQIPFSIDSSNLNNVDPKFDIDGYHLTSSSDCIDRGNNTAAQNITTDIDGDPRKVDGDNNGDEVVDIGADEFVPPMLDLDITNCTVTKRVSLSRVKPINIKLAVKNTGEVNGGETCLATVVGKQGGVQVYEEIMAVSDQIGKGPTIFQFPDYTPQNEGDIEWTATIDDDDPDDDVAMEITTVKQ